MSPVSTICSARSRPTMRGRKYEEPVSGMRPRLMKIWVKRARSDAIRMSQASARDSPAPAAAPLTAAMTGFSKFWSCRAKELIPPAAGERETSPRPTWREEDPSDERSAPEQNPSCALACRCRPARSAWSSRPLSGSDRPARPPRCPAPTRAPAPARPKAFRPWRSRSPDGSG